jgi:hypothetical protein
VRGALLGCGAVAALIAIGLVAMMIYMRRHPERMTDLLMRQVETNFAADVTAQEKEDLRSAYDRFRRSLVDGTAPRQSLQDMRGILLSRGMRSSVTRDQVHALTEVFRTGARPDTPGRASTAPPIAPVRPLPTP